MPWYWSYPYYYSPDDYHNMYMQPYIIQYPTSYSNYGELDQPIVAHNNLVKSNAYACKTKSKIGSEHDSRYLEPRWYPSGFSHTQRRRLQQMRKNNLEDLISEEKPANSTRTKKEWRSKQVNLTSA